jgi:hypothetical protein
MSTVPIGDINREEELLLHDLSESSDRILERANLTRREVRQQNNILGQIESGAITTASQLQVEAEHVTDILSETKNDGWLKFGIIVNIVFMIYLLITAL